MALQSGLTEASNPIPSASNGCKAQQPLSLPPPARGGRGEGAQIGVFQFSAPSFTPLNTKEQQFAGHPLMRKPNEMHKQLYRLLRLAGEGLVRLKLAGITVTTGVRLFHSSEVEIFFFSLYPPISLPT